jgi:HPt (histidine-containing phosphotransfer) domain-containing protein
MSVGAQPCPVDIDHLSRCTGGDAGLNAEVLRLFAGQVTELLSRLDAALAVRDRQAWKAVTHGLKGGARGIGAFALADVAAAAEPVDPMADAAQAHRVLHDLKSRALAVTLFIDAYLGR